MKKRTKITVALVIALVCVSVIAIGVFARNNPVNQKMQQLGQIDKQGAAAQAQSLEEVAYTGDHIQIMKPDLERFIKRISLTTDDEAEAESAALKAVAVREIFCYRAKEAGIPNDDEDFQAWLEEYRNSIESASNYEVFLSYVEGMGMTAEEYWDWAAEDFSIRNEWYSTLFTQKLQEDFAAENKLVVNSPEFTEQWPAYFTAYKDEAYESEHLKKAAAGEKQ